MIPPPAGFRLVAPWLRHTLGNGPRPHITDGRELVRAMDLHRVLPTLAATVSPHLDSGSRTLLSRMGRACAIEQLRHCAEVAQISRSARSAGLPFLLLKGQATIAQAYGGSMPFRQCRDADILVPTAHYRGFRSLLAALGGDWRTETASDKHLICAMPSGLEIEVHWRTGLEGLDAHLVKHWPRTTVTVGGEEMPTLEPEQAAIFAAHHGCLHAWYRLSWLLDLVLLTRRLKAEVRTNIAACAGRWGGRRTWAMGGVLAWQALGERSFPHCYHGLPTFIAHDLRNFLQYQPHYPHSHWLGFSLCQLMAPWRGLMQGLRVSMTIEGQRWRSHSSRWLRGKGW